MCTVKNLIFLAILSGALIWAAPAAAYCVYNQSNHTLHVCGGYCAHCFKSTIPVGGKACCPGGDKGCNESYDVSFSVGYGDRVDCPGWKTGHKVDAHGWVIFRGFCTDSFRECNADGPTACQNLTVTVYDRDGKGKVQRAGAVQRYWLQPVIKDMSCFHWLIGRLSY